MEEEERQSEPWNAVAVSGLDRKKNDNSVFSKAGTRNQYLRSQSCHVYAMFVNNNPVKYLILKSAAWGSERFSKWPKITLSVVKPGL